MSKKLLIVFLCLFGTLFVSRPAHGQQVELACPIGSQPVQSSAGITLNPSTGKQRYNFCVDALGNLNINAGNIVANAVGNALINPKIPASIPGYTGLPAKGDTQSSDNATITGSTLTCTDCAFTQADRLKTISCALTFVTSLAPTTIATVVSATVVTTATPTVVNGPCTVVWGTLDDVPMQAAVAAFNLALKPNPTAAAGNIGIMGSPAPILYIPTGNYSLTTCILISPSGGPHSGGNWFGDGRDNTRLTFLTGTVCTNALIRINSNTSAFHWEHMTIDGGNGLQTAGFAAVLVEGSDNVNYIRVQRTGTNTASYFSGQHDSISLESFANFGTGFQCQTCKGQFRGFVFSNNLNSSNMIFNGVSGSPVSQGVVMEDGLADESTNANGSISLVNAIDVWFLGVRAFGTLGANCVNIDGNSFLHWTGGLCGIFNLDNNALGVKIQAGGILQASDLRMISSGTGKCMNNAGVFYNNGGNSCESVFNIASGTSTGTTAVITTVNLGAAPNANCSVNDALIVENASIAGYNGYFPAPSITAVSAATITYTTTGSNLGALSAGGAIHCRNMQTYTGTLPKSLLTPSVTNFSEGTFNLTVNNLIGTWTPDRGIIIKRIQATNTGGNTACATAPILSLTNGVNTQTLTLTSGASSWDSGVVSVYMLPNTAITMTQTANPAVCATPPVNLNVSIFWYAGLDN